MLKAIDAALRSGICWLAAPAGYGKTTALADYLRGRSRPLVWYRVDEGDRDVASFFHDMARSLHATGSARRLPVFGPEYADQPEAFARRFFRAYFARLRRGTLLVLDDVHSADTPEFRAVLGVLLRELPETVRCACLSRTLPAGPVADLQLSGRLKLVDRSILEFSDREARALVSDRVRRARASIDVSAARGWAAGLVLLAERASAGGPRAELPRPGATVDDRAPVFAALARHLFEALPKAEQGVLLKLSLLPEITRELASALTGSRTARALLERLHQRQVLVSRGSRGESVYQLHDLLREFLQHRLARDSSAAALSRLRARAAALLSHSGRTDDAIDLALSAGAWAQARRLMVSRARTLLAEGRRATLVDWSLTLPAGQTGDPWLCYWLGVANMADDAAAEGWFSRAWTLFEERGEPHGQCLTAARAVLSKTDSWRTHEGLSLWTRRLLALIGRDLARLQGDDQLLAWSGMLRAVDFADSYDSAAPVVGRLTLQLLERLRERAPGDTATIRLVASQTLVDHAGSTGKADVFEQAVDGVAEDLRDPGVAAWVLGHWLVTFGSVSGRYFPYSKRGFAYASAEQALREAIAIGEREGLRGVEFGGLYHLQLQMKLRNRFEEFEALVSRIAEISDSRHTTQVAVAADCQAALHTLQGRFADAYRDCERFTAAIEEANEPPIERWPHFITRYQVLLADRKPSEATAFLNGILDHFDGEVRRRTRACVLIAEASAAKWDGAADYSRRLSSCLQELRQANWFAALINLPALLAELCADGLERGVEPDFCRSLVRRRALAPPATRPAGWPWALKVRVLGRFVLERDGVALALGAKAPKRSLDIVRLLAISKEHTCSLDEVCEHLWPDADGDQARAACDQALHRLRKLLGSTELLVQREGKLWLAPESVWVDLDDWEQRLGVVLRAPAAASDLELEAVLRALAGPLFQFEPETPWSLPVAERVRSKFLDLTARLARRFTARGEPARARTLYLRALDLYPAAESCYEALIRGCLAQGDSAGALDDYRRCERVLETFLATRPSPGVRALVAPLLAESRRPLPTSRAR